MVQVTLEQLMTPLAELEPYGIDPRSVNTLERYCGMMYVGDLVGIKANDLMDNGRRVGPELVRKLRCALSAFLNGE